MTTYKFILQREEPIADVSIVFETIHEFVSTDEYVVAETLRAIANRLAPSKPITRDGRNTNSVT
jgi:hypothetical protein